MGAQDIVNVQIGKELVEPIVKAKIAAAVVDAMGDPERVLSSFVDRMMRVQVDSNGKPSDYHGEPWLDWLARRSIRAAVETAVREWFEENTGTLKEVIKKQITKKPSVLVDAVLKGMTESFTNNWRLKFEVTVPKNE